MTTHAEQWKPIPGFAGYDASSHGRIRSYHKMGRLRNLSPSPQRILKASPNNRGYPVVGLQQNSQSRWCLVHRLVALAFLGPCPENQEVCHKDDNPANNHLENLRYDTHVGNMYGENELSISGCEHRAVTLYPEDWEVIRQRTQHDNSNMAIALVHIVREWKSNRMSRMSKRRRLLKGYRLTGDVCN